MVLSLTILISGVLINGSSCFFNANEDNIFEKVIKIFLPNRDVILFLVLIQTSIIQQNV